MHEEETHVSEGAEPAHKTVEDHAQAKGTEAVWLLAARALHQWPDLKRLSEQEFDAAISAAKTLECR